MPSSSFFTDGETYDTAVVTSNDTPASTTPSQAPSSFFSNGGVVAEGTVVSNETGPGPQSNTPSSFFTDGAVVASETVEINDHVPSTTPSQAPSSFFQSGNVYDYLNTESEVVALLQQLANTTTTNASAASTSASQASTSASQAATSATNAAASVQAVAGTATPLVDGTAAVGTSTHWAHEDHVHPTDTSRAAKTYVDTQDASTLSSAETYADNSAANAVANKAVRYDVAQTLTSGQQDQARSNIGIIQARNLANGVDLNTVVVEGHYITNVATVLNYPQALNNDQYFYISVQSFGVTGYCMQTAMGANSGRMFSRLQQAGTWLPWRRLVSDDIGPAGQCKLVYTNATTLTLMPCNGNNIKINGHIYQIPSGGITLTNTGFHPNTIEYIYAQVDGSGNVSLTFGEGGHSTSSTPGNVGVETYPGNDALSLVGMVYTSASSQFADTYTTRYVRSWFNDFGVAGYNGNTSQNTYTSNAWFEVDSSIRVTILFWANEQFDYIATAALNNSAASTTYIGPMVDGSVSGAYSWSTANYWVGGSAGAAGTMGEGTHWFSMGGVCGGGTAYYGGKFVKVSTVRK